VLGNLYTYSKAMVLPSFYEGFGMTLLEAMKCGCPVISSDRGALPEIAGNAAEYFSPSDIEHIRNTIEGVIFSEEKTLRLRRAGLERVRSFTWGKCAEETLGVYSHLLSQGALTDDY